MPRQATSRERHKPTFSSFLYLLRFDRATIKIEPATPSAGPAQDNARASTVPLTVASSGALPIKNGGFRARGAGLFAVHCRSFHLCMKKLHSRLAVSNLRKRARMQRIDR